MAIRNYNDPFENPNAPLVQYDPQAFADPTAGFTIPDATIPASSGFASQTTDPTSTFNAWTNQSQAIATPRPQEEPAPTPRRAPQSTPAPTTPSTPAPSETPAPPTTPTTPPPPRVYAQMPGWETGKLNDPTHTSVKYVFARTMQEMGGSAASWRGHLDGLAAAMRTKGYPNAKAVSDDQIDFGDGYGPIDVITSWGQWWWGPVNSSGGAGAASAGTAGTGTAGAGTTGAGTGGAGATGPTTPALSDPSAQLSNLSGEFNANPASELLTQLAYDRVARLSQTIPVPNLDAYVQQMLANRGTNDARATELANQIIRLADQYQQPTSAETAMLSQIEQLNRPGSSEQTLLDFINQLQQPGSADAIIQQRMKDLEAPPYTAGQEAALRAQALDAYEKRRQATLTNAGEDVSNRGFMPSSGVKFEQQRRINEEFEQGRTGIESTLLLNSITEAQKRAQERVTLAQSLEDRGLARKGTAAALSQELEATQTARATQAVNLSKDVTASRQARAERSTELRQMAQQAQASGDLVSLNYLAQISDIEAQMNAQADQQERERLIAAGIPYDVQSNNVQLALQILGMGGTPAQIVGALTGVQNANTAAQQAANQASAAKWAGLGSLASSALGAVGSYYANR